MKLRFALVLFVAPALAGEPPKDPKSPGPVPAVDRPAGENHLLDELDFREVDLRDALSVIAQESGQNLAATNEAAKTKVTIQLREVTALSAVQLICQTHALYFRRRTEDGIGVVTTAREFQDGLTIFREDKTRVFTLLYPNALDLAVAVRDLYGPRVTLSLGKEQMIDDSDEIQRRFNVFDILDQRGQSLGLFGGGGGQGGGQGSGGYGGGQQFAGGRGALNSSGIGSLRGGQFNSTGIGGQQQPQQQPTAQPERIAGLTDDERKYLEEAATRKDGLRGIELERLSGSRRANTNIYVTVVRRNNQVLVRTSDSQVLDEIEKLKERIDVPTPQVLLEVKVLSVDLRDGFKSIFDVQFSDGKNTASFATGNIIPPGGLPTVTDRTGIGLTVGGTGKAIPSPFGLDPSALIYQFVDNNFRVRMQLLDDRNRVTIVATPVLLAANNEVSRLFIGEERPIIRNISSNAGTAGLGGAVLGGGSATIEFRPVGTTLLITPNINADRTVTLRLLQENSLINPGAATIPVVAADGTVTNQPVDVVASRTLTATVIAKDGLTLALGGLIDEGLSDAREEVPVVGRIPVLGFFFRRQATGRYRRELVIVIRPYILSTPIEGEALSKRLTDSLSLNPKSPNLYPAPGDPVGPFGTYNPHEPLRPNPPPDNLKSLLRFHSVLPADF